MLNVYGMDAYGVGAGVEDLRPKFQEWPKMARLNRDVIVTEKIDGTNACVVVTPDGVYAQSRTRCISPGGDDNFGFAAWVEKNKISLRALLGDGYHFGEWWGHGIQRGYGKSDRTFSLFNTHRWHGIGTYGGLAGLDCVPILDQYTFDSERIGQVLEFLKLNGSQAARGFMQPEGIAVFHTKAGVSFKVTLNGDGAKGNG